MSIDLSGKTAIVTGGAAGIGRVIIERFVAAGAGVSTCDVDGAALADLRAALPDVVAIEADVGRSADVGRLFDAHLARFGGLDALLNNAGVSGPTKPVEAITDEEWAHTMTVNVTGQFYCVRRAVPLFRAAGGGAIVNISSVAGRLGMPLRVPYSTSKYAVRGLTDVLAVELGEIGVRVNAILPGLVDGPRGRRVIGEQAAVRGMTYEDYLPYFLHNISMHTPVQMVEIADLAVFLASDLAPHISGQSISVCGNFESYRAPMVPPSA